MRALVTLRCFSRKGRVQCTASVRSARTISWLLMDGDQGSCTLAARTSWSVSRTSDYDAFGLISTTESPRTKSISLFLWMVCGHPPDQQCTSSFSRRRPHSALSECERMRLAKHTLGSTSPAAPAPDSSSSSSSTMYTVSSTSPRTRLQWES